MGRLHCSRSVAPDASPLLARSRHGSPDDRREANTATLLCDPQQGTGAIRRSSLEIGCNASRLRSRLCYAPAMHKPSDVPSRQDVSTPLTCAFVALVVALVVVLVIVGGPDRNPEHVGCSLRRWVKDAPGKYFSCLAPRTLVNCGDTSRGVALLDAECCRDGCLHAG